MRRLWPICFAWCLAANGVAAPAPFGGGSKSFGAWTGTCNNLGACVAIGSASDELFYVRIARGAGAVAPTEVKIVLVASAPLEGAGPPAFALTAVDDSKRTVLDKIAAKVEGDDKDRYGARLASGEATLAFIAAIRNATTLDYGLLDAKGSLDLKGFGATLRWIDARQGRAGTPTALVARGMTPIGQVHEPAPAPVVHAAPAGSVAEIVKPILGQPLLSRAQAIEACDKDVVAAHEGARAWRLDAGHVLYAVPCASAAYNFSSALFVTDENGAHPEPVALPSASGEMGPSNVVTNADFDPKTMALTEFDKGRGIGDCGDLRTWLWTGRNFALLDDDQLEACPGALPEDWPSLFHAERK